MRLAQSLAWAVVFGWCGAAFAQSDRELATRQEMLAQADQLSDQGRHAEALVLAKRAAAIKSTPSLRLFLAREQSALGLLADAYGNGRQCAVEAEADERLNNRDRILSACKEIEASLGQRVGRVTVKLATPLPPNVHVTLSGEEINTALIGEPYVVSPGKLAIQVTATGYLPYHSDIDVPEGGSPEVDVELLPDPVAQACALGLERVHGQCVAVCPTGKVRTTDEAAQCCWTGQTWSSPRNACEGAPQCPRGLEARGVECAPPAQSAGRPGRSSSRRVWSVIIGSVGVAGIGLGAGFGFAALSTLNEAERECAAPYTHCSAQSIGTRGTAVTFGDVSTAGFVAGAALLAGGLTLYLTAPAEPTRVGFQWAPGRVGVTGEF